MSKCKLVVNKLSGNAKNIEDLDEAKNLILSRYDNLDVSTIDEDNDLDMTREAEGYDALAVCGGDGTLNSAINAIKDSQTELIYIPCGTLNDAAKSLALNREDLKTEKKFRSVDIGRVNERMFAYVLAGGTFTEIGYLTRRKNKKRFKFLAYLLMVLKTYKVHRIGAKITADGKFYGGDFTLIMAINSSRCFGFRFNKRYVCDDGKGQLLLIRSPRRNGLLGKAEIFFPFFRAFFMGFKRERETKNLIFRDFTEFTLELDEKTDFTVDGEKIVLDGKNEAEILARKLDLIIF